MSELLAGRLPERAFAGVLFDMDGTLIDSIAAVERSWLLWTGEYGVDPLLLRGTHGQTAHNTIASIMADRTEDERGRAHTRIREIEVADTEGIVVLPGAREALATLDDLGVPHAIVTSGERELAEARITATALPRPSVIVTANDVAHGKPGPEPYERGAELLGLDPAECLVVEDAVAGLVSARAAGAGGTLAVMGTSSVEVLAPEADAVVAGLSEVEFVTDPSTPGVRLRLPRG